MKGCHELPVELRGQCCTSCHNDEIVNYLEDEEVRGEAYLLCCTQIESVKSKEGE